MFVMNFKLNGKRILLICVLIAALASAIVEGIHLYNQEQDKVDIQITDENFTTVLKDIHENIDSNIGKKIKLSGFVFTMPDFKENYFVCGRNMLMNDDAKVVGFLCEYDKFSELTEPEWIEITGTFIKGYYTCDMPVIYVESCKKIPAPANTFVNPPANWKP